MIYLLTVSLLLLLVTVFLIKRSNVLSPSFIIIGSFFVVALFYCVFFGTIGRDISFKTAIIILISLIMFFFGEMLFNIKFKDPALVFSKGENSKPRTIISLFSIFVFSLTIIAITIIRYVYIARLFGSSLSISSFIVNYSSLRFKLVHNPSVLSLPSWVGYLTIIAGEMFHLCFFFFVKDVVYYKKANLLYLVPVFLYILMLVTYTSRTVFLEAASYCLFSFGFLSISKVRDIKRAIRKILLFAIASFSLFIVAFYSIGILTNKITDFSSNIVGYTAASLVGLDTFLANGYEILPLSEKRTLFGIFSFLSKLGFSFPESDLYLPYFDYNGQTSNIYTCLMEPIWDYGVLPMLVTRIILGLVFSIVYYICMKQIKSNKEGVSICLISTYYYLIIASIDDKFITMLGSYFVYQIIANIIVVRLFLKRNKQRKNDCELSFQSTFRKA